ncbi:hypothetical protein EYF80_032431 [Liparis tanakae]|uniref:Uncharacterized protein n=1 Tax=Liparis tanakae TaxID=230148 RepID=A0A4Z2GW82_9TELE|nr:hypothetical protein EYF80_032431 [Liparis tanakae]
MDPMLSGLQQLSPEEEVDWLTHPMPQHQWYGPIVGGVNWAASSQQHRTSQEETQEGRRHLGS